MAYVMYGHTNVMLLAVPLDNYYYFFQVIWKSWAFQHVMGGFFAVDAFFFLSGFLVTYAYLEFQKESGNWGLGILHRWLRLTPLYLLIIILSTDIFPYLGSGPMYYQPRPKDNCVDYWWSNILYINNFFPDFGGFGKMCAPWGWYLANDFQLFLITPLFLWLYQKKKMAGILSMIVILLACTITVAMLTYKQDIKFFSDDNYTTSLYTKPWTRFGPYIVGVGLCLLWREMGKIKISPVLRICGYTSMSILLLTTIFGTYTNQSSNEGWSLPEKIAYFSLSRIAFAIALGILSFFILNGYATLIKKFLSFSFWTPLARLTYAAYLVHPLIMILVYFNIRHMSWSYWFVIFALCGFFRFGLFCCVFVVVGI